MNFFNYLYSWEREREREWNGNQVDIVKRYCPRGGMTFASHHAKTRTIILTFFVCVDKPFYLIVTERDLSPFNLESYHWQAFLINIFSQIWII